MKYFLLSIVTAIGSLFGIHSQSIQQATSTQVNTQTESVQLSVSETNRLNQVLANAKAEQISAPVSGYLVPNNIPSGYTLTGSRFTSHSTNWQYNSQKSTQFGQTNEFLSISETASSTFNMYVKTETESAVQNVRVVKNFTFNGSSGAILGGYFNAKTVQAGEYWLAYDDKGKLFTIHTTDPTAITPDMLISLLKATTLAK